MRFLQNPRYLALVPALFALVFYAHTFGHDYVLDDEDAIVKNATVQKGFSGIGKIWNSEYRSGFSSESGSLYRPMALSLFAAEWAFWPGNPHPAHAINVLLYALCCWLLFLWLAQLFSSKDPWLIFFITLLFTLHPIHTEVVANIKSADELLAMLFSLLAMLALLKYYDEGLKALLVISGLAFFLALSSKEGVITLFAVIPIMLLLFRSRDWKKMGFSMASIGAAIVAYFILRVNALQGLTGTEEIPVLDNMLAEMHGFERIISAIGLWAIYLSKLIFPEALSHDYSIVQIEPMNFLSFPVIAGILAMVALVYVVIKWRAKQPILVFAIAFLVLTFSIYSNVVLLIGTHMGDRLMFLPSIGFCMAVGWLFWKWSTLKRDAFHWKSMGLGGIFFLLTCSMYGVKTFNRAKQWKNEFTLYSADVLNAPFSTRTHYRLGLTLNKQGLNADNEGEKKRLFQSAIKELKISVEIYPEFADALAELGLSYQSLGNYEEAAAYNAQTLRINPNHVSATNNTGAVFFLQGMVKKAIPYFKRTLELNPNYREAAGNLGSCYGSTGEYEEAIKWFKRSIDIDPGHAPSYFFIALTYQNMGEQELSDQWIKKARQLDPNIGK